jgi:hypothetical protein
LLVYYKEYFKGTHMQQDEEIFRVMSARVLSIRASIPVELDSDTLPVYRCVPTHFYGSPWNSVL